MAPPWLRLHPLSLAYAATTLGATLMNAVFTFYYVKVYLNRFHVSESWFQVSQIVFMIWNAINDPLFGYLQDNYNWSWVKSRRHSILYGAPLFVVSFLITWFPWGDYSQPTWLSGFQLMISLCFYDALFTFVLLAQCALFAEISSQHDDRIRLIRYAKVCSIIGSSSVFFCNLASNNLTDYSMFLLVNILIAIVSLICMVYSGLNAHTQYDRKALQQDQLLNAENNGQEPVTKHSPYSYIQQTFQIFSQPSFVSFVLVNLMQIFHMTWLANFTAIICDSLIPDTVLSSEVRSTFYGSLFILPPVTVILGTPLVSRIGYYNVIRYSFYIKLVFGLGLFMTGPLAWALVVFFILESVNVNAIFGLFDLCLSDIIDVDKEKYQRSHPVSSMVFGTNALVTKPAQSLAPMAAVAILNNFGYQQFKSGLPSSVSDRSITDSLDIRDLHSVMFYMCCIVPVVIGIIQVIIWKFYTIRTTHITIARYVDS